jgi:magnesium-protoporphyrin O-methyltransferase
VPISERTLRRHLRRDQALQDWRVGRTQRIASGFYKSQAMELGKL